MCYHHDKHVLFPWISVPHSVLRVICKLASREAKYLSRSHLHGARGVQLATEVQTGAAESMAEVDPSSLPGRGSFAFQLGAVGTQPALAAQEKSWINACLCRGMGICWRHCWGLSEKEGNGLVCASAPCLKSNFSPLGAYKSWFNKPRCVGCYFGLHLIADNALHIWCKWYNGSDSKSKCVAQGINCICVLRGMRNSALIKSNGS